MRTWWYVTLLALLVSATACSSSAPATAPAGATAPTSGVASAPPAAAPGASATPARAPDKLRVAYNAVTADQTPIWLAQDAGIYLKHGLDVELVSMQTSSQIAPALMSGELGIAYSAGAGTVAATLQGADLVMLSSFEPWLRFWLYTKPELTSVAQLRGTRMGVTRYGGGLHLAAVLTVQRAGMDPTRDLVMSQLGGNAEIFTALISGAVDSGWVLPPQSYVLEDAGFRRLVDTLDYHIPYTMGGATGSKRYISEHEDIVRRFIRAHMESLALFASDKEQSKRVMAKWTGIDNPDYLERAYQDSLSSMELIPYTTPDTIQTVLDYLAEQIPAARTANPEDFIDNRFVREVVESNPPWLPKTATGASAH